MVNRINSLGTGIDVATEDRVFLSGWFTTKFESGEQPDYGYPKNHLPDVPVDFEVEVKTGFLGGK